MSRANTTEVMYGKEPPITMSLIRLLNWYSATTEPKDAKVYCVNILGVDFEKIDASYFPTLYPLLRLQARGYEFDERQRAQIEKRIATLAEKRPPEVTDSSTKKTRIQEIFEVADKVNQYLDQMIKTQRINFDAQLFDFSACSKEEKEIIRKEISEFTKDFEDENFTEYYSVGKIFARRILSFKAELMNKLTAKRAVNRKPRVTKAVDAAKTTSKVKFANAYPAAQVEGQTPIALVGKTIALVIDIESRKLIKYHAAEGQKFEFKGTTLQNVDLEKSKSKTLRKPIEQVRELASLTTRQGLKFFDAISAVERDTTGRFNENMVILRII